MRARLSTSVRAQAPRDLRGGASLLPTKRARAPATRRCAARPSLGANRLHLREDARQPARSVASRANRGLRRADASASPRNDRPAILCSSAASTASVGSARTAAPHGPRVGAGTPQIHGPRQGPAARGPVPSTPKNKRGRSARPPSSRRRHARGRGVRNSVAGVFRRERHVAGPLEARAASNKIARVAQCDIKSQRREVAMHRLADAARSRAGGPARTSRLKRRRWLIASRSPLRARAAPREALNRDERPQPALRPRQLVRVAVPQVLGHREARHRRLPRKERVGFSFMRRATARGMTPAPRARCAARRRRASSRLIVRPGQIGAPQRVAESARSLSWRCTFLACSLLGGEC